MNIPFLKTTIGIKHLVGLSGLLWVGFLLGHVSGNFLMFVGPDAYNMYGHKLVSNPLIYVVEAALVLTFVAHAGLAIRLAIKNKRARPQEYAVSAEGVKKTSLLTKSLWMQGVLILIFLALHLYSFKFGAVYKTVVDGQEIRDLFRLLVEEFQSPVFSGWYILCVSIVGWHLSHGFNSAMQTLGLSHPKYKPLLEKASVALGLYVGVGFLIQPIYIFFFYKG